MLVCHLRLCQRKDGTIEGWLNHFIVITPYQQQPNGFHTNVIYFFNSDHECNGILCHSLEWRGKIFVCYKFWQSMDKRAELDLRSTNRIAFQDETKFIPSAYQFKDAFFPENRFLGKKDLGIWALKLKKYFWTLGSWGQARANNSIGIF